MFSADIFLTAVYPYCSARRFGEVNLLVQDKTPVLEKLKRVYGQLTDPQKRVADFIINHPDDARDCSVATMCRHAETSEPVVFAVCRAAGRKGYRELKLDLAGEVAVLREKKRRKGSNGELRSPDVELNGNETPGSLAHKIGAIYLESVSAAIENLDAGVLSRAVDALAAAGKVVVFGMGTSGYVARIAHYALTRVGVTATYSADSYVQLVQLAALEPGDVALGISYRGEQPELGEAVRLARGRSAVIVAVTSMPDSELGRAADLILELPPRRPLASYVSVGARIAAAELYVVDALAAGVLLAGDRKKFDERSRVVSEVIEARKVSGKRRSRK
jgi:DNA-binding MurR/RpiR family transcriptional regulator